ncbi:MAG: hypothetical protein JO184_01400 [Gammaproteobacteria bacterium]|nr:hypothetical protein [Gammaproteobacteria bacterium]
MERIRRHRIGRAAPIGAVWVILLALPGLVAAQAAPATGGHEIPRPDELEPGVTTTPATPAPASAAVPEGPQAPAPGASPAAKSSAKATAGGAPAGGTKAAAHKGPDKLELDATDITGNRELPKVLYIVPWKRSDLGDVVGRPVNSLLDEVLQPLDRDVFQRENRYYDALKPGAGDGKSGAAQGSPSKP